MTLTVDTEKSRSLFCSDWFFFGTNEMYHIETFYLSGKHQITFKNLSPQAKIDIMANGVKVYMFCDGYVDTFTSVYNTILMFAGGIGTNGSDPSPYWGAHVPEYMVKANLDFLNETMGYNIEDRPSAVYDYDPDLIQSGDFIAIFRLDGVDPIIMYGTGTHSGHSVMALRMDGELYIVES